MKKFEYKSEYEESWQDDDCRFLNEQGEEGWELVSILHNSKAVPGMTVKLIFKREKQPVNLNAQYGLPPGASLV